MVRSMQSVDPHQPALAAFAASRPHAGWAAWCALACVTLALVLSGCASGPKSPPPSPQRDGPPLSVPPNIADLPEVVPQIEPIRQGGPNKPYVVLGQSYEPLQGDVEWSEKGGASWYGNKFHGRRTASGELYSMFGLTAAHKTLPIPSYVRVRNVRNGKEVIVRVNDRGPFHPGRVIDLSYAAAVKLDIAAHGVGQVEIARLTFDEIRSGAGQRALARHLCHRARPHPGIPRLLGAARGPEPSRRRRQAAAAHRRPALGPVAPAGRLPRVPALQVAGGALRLEAGGPAGRPPGALDPAAPAHGDRAPLTFS